MGTCLSPELLFETAKAGTSRNQATNDHVLLEAPQPIALTLDCRLCQHPGGLLEGGRRDEAVGVQRGLGDTQQHRGEFGGGATGDCHGGVHLFHLTQLDELAGQEGGVSRIFDADLAGHLAHNHFDVLVVNRHALGLVHVLHFGHHPELQLGDRLLGRIHRGLTAAQILEVALEQLVGIDRTVGEGLTSMDLLAVAHHDVAAQQDRVIGHDIVVLNDRHRGVVVIITLLDLHGAALAAEDCGFPGAAGFQQFFNTGQTLNNVAGLLAFKHQQGEAVAPLHQFTVTDVEHRIGRHHVGTAKADGDGVGIDGFHLPAARGWHTLRQQITVDDALVDLHPRLDRAQVNHAGVGIPFDDQTANRLALNLLGDLQDTVFLAKDLGGSHHVALLDADAVFHLEVGVGGTVAGIREGVPADQQRLKNGELKTLNRLGALVGHSLHIHRHLRCGVVGIENQLGAQEFHTFHRLNQLTVLKGQALGGL